MQVETQLRDPQYLYYMLYPFRLAIHNVGMTSFHPPFEAIAICPITSKMIFTGCHIAQAADIQTCRDPCKCSRYGTCTYVLPLITPSFYVFLHYFQIIVLDCRCFLTYQNLKFFLCFLYLTCMFENVGNNIVYLNCVNMLCFLFSLFCFPIKSRGVGLHLVNTDRYYSVTFSTKFYRNALSSFACKIFS
jgi:hypothetical protein